MNRTTVDANWHDQKGKRNKKLFPEMDDESVYFEEREKEYRKTRVKPGHQKKNLRDFFQGSDK